MKRLAILQTDSVLEEFRSDFGDYPAMFKELLSEADAELVSIDVRESAPASGFADAYVITGSKCSVYDDLPWISPFVEFLRGEIAAERPIVGICFGHQLIAHYFGGEVRAAEQGWAVGVHEAHITVPLDWMEPAAPSFKILSSHQDQVMRMPDGAQLIASTPFCPVSGYVIGDKVLGLQGHPEFSKGYAKRLMQHREEKLGAETFSGGIASLQQDLDTQLVARWMLNFLRVSK